MSWQINNGAEPVGRVYYDTADNRFVIEALNGKDLRLKADQLYLSAAPGGSVVFGSPLKDQNGNDVAALPVGGRPAFLAEASSHVTGTGTIVFDDVVLNRGGHYNSATGEFTAPADGLYMFGIVTVLYNMGSYSQVQLMVNGNAFANNGNLGVYGQFSGSYAGQSGSTVVALSQGDVVTFYFSHYGTRLHNGYTKAWGVMIG